MSAEAAELLQFIESMPARLSFAVSLITCATVDFPDSPYLRCTDGEVSAYHYDCRKYWRCQNELWTVEGCPESLMWSEIKKGCVSDTAQCWLSNRVCKYILA